MGRRFCFGPISLRAKTAQKDRQLLELIDPVAESLGLEVVRVRLMSGSKRQRLQIMAERPSDHDISVEQCAKLSRAVPGGVRRRRPDRRREPSA